MMSLSTVGRSGIMRRVWSLAMTLSVFALMAVAASCGTDQPDTDDGPMGTEGASRGTETRPSDDNAIVSAASTDDPNSVDVRIKEFEVRMPTILKPGAYLFHVTNDGTEPHGLTVEGNGMSVSLPTDAQPGETQSLPVDLAPGTYKVYCPIDGHDERGMTAVLTVSE